MPKANSKIINWICGILGTLVSTLIVGSMSLLVKLDNRTEQLVTIIELTSKHLKEGIDKSTLSSNKNTQDIQHVKERVTKLEYQNEKDARYNLKLDNLHETVKDIEDCVRSGKGCSKKDIKE